jgi:hypothetical protein
MEPAAGQDFYGFRKNVLTMGGFGSGRPQTRRYLDSLIRIEISALRRLLARPGTVLSVEWGSGNTLAIRVEHEMLVLQYAIRRGDVAEEKDARVALERQPRHYGGFEAYFRCPLCDRRCSKLYLLGSQFRCRHCTNLPYRSQSLAPEDRLARAHNRYRRKIDLDATRLDLGVIPDRPKGMHRATYDRLTERALAVLEAREAILDDQIVRVLTRMGFGQDLS